jgi:hypothetical protein
MALALCFVTPVKRSQAKRQPFKSGETKMRIIKLIVIALILGLTGIIYAAGGQQTPADEKSKAASCCMKEQKSGDAKTAHKSCDTTKSGEGCCNAKADCCKPGAECCKAGAECCKTGDSSCCAHMQDKQGKAQARNMQKDGKGCCADSECCKSGSCSKEKVAQQ